MKKAVPQSALVALILACAQTAGADVFFQGFGPPPNSDWYHLSGVTALSPDGSVAIVQARNSTPYLTGVRPQSYRWTPGSEPLPIDTGGAFGGGAVTFTAASWNGGVAVGRNDVGFPSEHSSFVPVRQDGSSVQQLGPVASAIVNGVATAVSANGQIAAGFGIGPDEQGVLRYRGLLFPTPTTQVVLPGAGDVFTAGISGAGDRVVGTIYGPGGSPSASYWDNGEGPILLSSLNPGLPTEGTAISSNGEIIVGNAYAPDFAFFRTFIWTLATGVEVLDEGETTAEWTTPTGVSADGTVIVGYMRRLGGTNGDESFLWTRAGGLRRLQDVLSEAGLDVSQWVFNGGVFISEDGLTLAGSGFHIDIGREAWVARIPAPGGSALLILTVVMASRRRRAHAGNPCL